jgi:hypothetical protein
VNAIKEYKLMSERQTVINGLRIVGTLFCVSCNIVLLLIASSHFVNNDIQTYCAHNRFRIFYFIISSCKTTAHTDEDAVIINKEFKVPSQNRQCNKQQNGTVDKRGGNNIRFRKR